MTRTGRPRQYDLDRALDAALRLFWEHGYEATSIAALRAATGLSSASFYAAFSSKESLFDAVVRRYNSTFGQVTDVVADHDLPPRAAVEQMLRGSAAMQTDPDHPAGCLVVLAGINAAPGHDRVRALLADRRGTVRADLAACVARAVDAGELSPRTDTTALATALETFMWGLSTEARDRVPREYLDAAVDQVMTLWDRCRPEPGAAPAPVAAAG